MEMKTIKVFLASSAELKEDREQFEIWIYRKCKEWMTTHKLFLHLEIWEDFIDAMSATSLQDEYNKAIKNCDIFIMLLFTKVGKYTEIEFSTAFGHFQETQKPFIFTYFKDVPITVSEINENIVSLLQFKKRLNDLGHFCSVYKNIEDLKLQINNQFEKLYIKDFKKMVKAESVSEQSVLKSNEIHIEGHNNMVFQNIKKSNIKGNDIQ
jgi:hypothetical protein